MSEKTNFKLYGINDDHDTCSECGKTNLKRVMWIGLDDDIHDPAPYGTTCGARKLSVSAAGGSKKVWSNVISAGIAQIEAARVEFIENECFIRQGIAIPKPMIFVEWRAVQNGDMTIGEFAAVRNEQFPVIASYDAGSFFSGQAGLEKLNGRLMVAKNAPVGIKVIRPE